MVIHLTQCLSSLPPAVPANNNWRLSLFFFLQGCCWEGESKAHESLQASLRTLSTRFALLWGPQEKQILRSVGVPPAPFTQGREQKPWGAPQWLVGTLTELSPLPQGWWVGAGLGELALVLCWYSKKPLTPSNYYFYTTFNIKKRNQQMLPIFFCVRFYYKIYFYGSQMSGMY